MFQKHLLRYKKRTVRYTLISANFVLLLAVVLFVVKNPNSGNGISQSITSVSDTKNVASPLDQLSSADIAVNAASMAGLPESVSTANLADSVKVQLAIAPADTQVVARPQVVITAAKSINDIRSYTVQAGDNVSKIARKFDVTSDSIRWSNGITGNEVRVGAKLWISPISDGFLYVVKSGDTPASLASKFGANKDKLININDADIAGLKVGRRIIIPGGTLPTATATFANYGSFSWGGGAAIYGSNGYDYGWCTWYVANKVAVPSNWGNAVAWAYAARLTPGWRVDNTPVVGMVAQRMGGLGHVAVVEAVSPDGKMIKYSDMNGISGWGRVGYSDWVPVSTFSNYIHH